MAYTIIPKIEKDSLKTFVTNSVLNPLVEQHNSLGSEVQSLGEKVLELEESITNSSSGATVFTQLLDTPSTLEGSAGKTLIVNDDENRLIFVPVVSNDDLQADVDRIHNEVVYLQGEQTIQDKRLDALESGAPSETKKPTKWYILPLAGQSNMWGCGEAPWEIPEINPRLMQLGVNSSYEQTESENQADTRNTGPVVTPYGDDFRKYRPVDETNLTLIPAVPCLDSAHNGFQIGYFSPVSGGVAAKTHKYGNVGYGYFLAKQLLNHIPEEYGIIIVNASRGGGGICSQTGSYDSATMLPSTSANGHGEGHPFNRMLKDRVKYLLGQNPENKLLPFIWSQGESDPDAAQHYTAFKLWINGIKSFIETNGFQSRLPQGSIDNLKIICVGTTKVIYGSDIGLNHLDTPIKNRNFKHTYRARYDNYAYLMDDVAYQNPETGEGYITYLRADIGEDGNYIETALEENRVRGVSGVFSSALDTHFSTRAVSSQIPRLIVNAISGSKTGYLINTDYKVWTRDIPGRMGTVSTDNVRYIYNKTPDIGFDPEKDLYFKRCFVTDETFTGDDTTLTSDTVELSTYEGSPVGYFDGTNKYLQFSNTATTADKTISVFFKTEDAYRLSTMNLITPPSSSQKSSPLIQFQDGQLFISPEFENETNNICANKAYVGAWDGQFSDWQHVVITSSYSLNLSHVYLNGNLIGTIKDSRIKTWTVRLGLYSSSSYPFRGYVKSLRLYNRALKPGEVAALNLVDRNLQPITTQGD